MFGELLHWLQKNIAKDFSDKFNIVRQHPVFIKKRARGEVLRTRFFKK